MAQIAEVIRLDPSLTARVLVRALLQEGFSLARRGVVTNGTAIPMAGE